MPTVVIGGGLSGLSAALTLQEAGEEVELFEGSSNIGGRVRTDYIDGYTLDHGFQLINAGYSEIKRLGLIPEIDFVPFSRSLDVVTPMGVTSIGDPRRQLVSALNSPLATLSEKLAFISYLRSKSVTSESVEAEMMRTGLGNLYHNVVRPFLTGVFLAPLTTVDAVYAKEIVKSFLFGESGLPRAGAGVLAEALGARIENIHLDHKVTSLDEFGNKNIIIATDGDSADRLLGRPSTTCWTSSYTWYHSLPVGSISSKNLRVSSASTPLVNSIVISNTISDFAPAGKILISTTALTDLTDSQVLTELEKFWGLSGFEGVQKYSIPHSLPLFAPGSVRNASTSRIGERIFLAGDYTSAGSQNAALLSGRFAATELLAQLTR